jgi:hypothetical protein
MMQGFIAHVDTTRVSRQLVMDVVTPDRTKTWGVIGHGQLVETLTHAVENAGHRIVNQDYSLSGDGGKLFGAFTLDHATGELAWMIGFRNSVNKSMALGITAGNRIFVCDNMAFSGSFIQFRKHTGGLDTDKLQELANDAVGEMETRLLSFENWHMSLKNYTLKRQDMEALTFRAVEQGVLPGGRFGAFHKLLFQKENEDNNAVYDDTLYGFHGAMTQLWKKNSLVGSGSRHAGLQKLLAGAQAELTEHQMIRNAA